MSDGGYAQSKTSLATVRALAQAGFKPAVTVSGRHSMAAASRYCLRRVRTPSVDDDPAGFRDAIREAVDGDEYLTVLPTSDPVIRAVEAPSARLLDKAFLEQAAATVGLECPPGRLFASAEDLLADASSFSYPVVVKPTSYHGTVRADRPEDLRSWIGRPGPLLVQPYVRDERHALSGVVWEGRVPVSARIRYVRTWPEDPGGHAAAVVTIGPDPDLEERLSVLLREHRGPFQAQFRGRFLVDLNPRVSTSLPAAVAAGANLPAAFCDLLAGRGVAPRRAAPGVFYRWIDGDVRSVVWSVAHRRMTPAEGLRSLLPRRGTIHGPESLRDPGPMLARVRHALFASRDGSAGE